MIDRYNLRPRQETPSHRANYQNTLRRQTGRGQATGGRRARDNSPPPSNFNLRLLEVLDKFSYFLQNIHTRCRLTPTTTTKVSRYSQLNNMREIGKLLKDKLKLGHGCFGGKDPGKVLTFIMTGETVLSYYTVGPFHLNDSTDMVEQDAINVYIVNMDSTAADWYKGQRTTNPKIITSLEAFKTVIVEKFFGSVTHYDSHQLLQPVRQGTSESTDMSAQHLNVAAMHIVRRIMMEKKNTKTLHDAQNV